MNKLQDRLIYVELKTGYNDNGPAWIGKAKFSKSGRTIYFNGHALQSCKGRGIGANYFDAKSGEEYWVSGAKKNGQDRHWAGSGIITVDEAVADEYAAFLGVSKLDPRTYRTAALISAVPDLESNEEEA